jgi:HNH endonuclease
MSGDVSAGDVALTCDNASQMSGPVSARDDTDREQHGESQMSGDVSARDVAGTCDGGSQMSGVRRTARLGHRFGRATLRWSVTERTYRFWRALERAFMRVRTRVCREPASFLRFLCENFCRTWLPALRNGCLTESGELPEYFHVYRRDAFRCSSPVCRRRDVTPHHLVFRSHGGGDEDENVASLCSWCHLCGVHEGRIGAEPPASRIRWRIGRNGTLRVDGRTRRLRRAIGSEGSATWVRVVASTNPLLRADRELIDLQAGAAVPDFDAGLHARDVPTALGDAARD